MREAVSLSADEALAQNVIDLEARDVPELLTLLDGRKVSTAGGERVLATAGATVLVVEPDWKTRFLAVITDPGVALILMMLGVYGLFFEFSNPGFVLPGVVGAICLCLGLFALNMLPVNYAGLALVLLGLAFLIGEVFLPTLWIARRRWHHRLCHRRGNAHRYRSARFRRSLLADRLARVLSAAFIFLVGGVALKARRRPSSRATKS